VNRYAPKKKNKYRQMVGGKMRTEPQDQDRVIEHSSEDEEDSSSEEEEKQPARG